MKYYLNNNQLKILKIAEEITRTNYEINDNYILDDSLIIVIEELIDEVDHLNECIKELKSYYENK